MLPIKKVILSNDVSFIERRGTLQPGQPSELLFSPEQWAIAQTSLSIVDAKGQPIPGVTVNFSESQNRPLEDLSVLIGTRVEITADGKTYAGHFLRREEKIFRIFCHDGSLLDLPVESVKSMRILDEGLNALLQSKFDMNPNSQLVKKAIIYSTNPEPIDAIVTYHATSLPWSINYRFFVSSNGESSLQGYCNIENTQESNWDAVDVTIVQQSLVSGNAFGDASQKSQALFGKVVNSNSNSNANAQGRGRKTGRFIKSSNVTHTPLGPVTLLARRSGIVPVCSFKCETSQLCAVQGNSIVDAFCFANTFEVSLLPGTVALHLDGAFIGMSSIERVVKHGESCLLKLGAHEGVTVSKNTKENRYDFHEARYGNGKITLTQTFVDKTTYYINNRNATGIDVLVLHVDRKSQGWKIKDEKELRSSQVFPDLCAFELSVEPNSAVDFCIEESRSNSQSSDLFQTTRDEFDKWRNNGWTDSNVEAEMKKVFELEDGHFSREMRLEALELHISACFNRQGELRKALQQRPTFENRRQVDPRITEIERMLQQEEDRQNRYKHEITEVRKEEAEMEQKWRSIIFGIKAVITMKQKLQMDSITGENVSFSKLRREQKDETRAHTTYSNSYAQSSAYSPTSPSYSPTSPSYSPSYPSYGAGFGSYAAPQEQAGFGSYAAPQQSTFASSPFGAPPQPQSTAGMFGSVASFGSQQQSTAGSFGSNSLFGSAPQQQAASFFDTPTPAPNPVVDVFSFPESPQAAPQAAPQATFSFAQANANAEVAENPFAAEDKPQMKEAPQ